MALASWPTPLAKDWLEDPQECIARLERVLAGDGSGRTVGGRRTSAADCRGRLVAEKLAKGDGET